MSWSPSSAAERIERHRRTAPEADIKVSEFADYMRSRRTMFEAARTVGSPNRETLWFVPGDRAVTTHGVHIYANLLDYNAALTEAGRETEASHSRALQLLHLHYSACEHLLAAFAIERVDFHGARLHAVVLTPEGASREGERVDKAIAFAAAFRQMVAEGGRRYGDDLQTAVRVGIDSGPAVAVNSGRRSEPEPLFIGSPANYAAKLAAGEEAEIFLTPRAAAARNSQAAAAASRVSDQIEQAMLGDAAGLRNAFGRSYDAALSNFVKDQDALMKAHGGVRPASFTFHYREPPLRTIRFHEHPPSNTVRLPLASLFADIDGFTNYIDECITQGRIAQAVANLHVMRAEMADVLQEDFAGRKVRFVGDCLHGVLAVGGPRGTDGRETVRRATLAAAGIRSSFDLCKRVLPGIGGLGIAIGIEFGATPICRLGLRGDGGVRCSSSKATCVSEERQGACNGTETGIGERAFQEGGGAVQQLFGRDRKVRNLTYASALALIEGLPAGAAARSSHAPLEAHTSL